MKLKIVSNFYPKIFNLCNLSRNLSINSEIYLIKEDEEILLGFINHHALVYFCVEFADYSLQNYTKAKIPKAERCISLVRKWIKDPTSVSKEDLEAAYHAAYNTFAYASASAANSAINADYAHYAVNVAANIAADAADYAGKKKEEELIRQGEFILDYLKSGLYLFHLEK